MRFIALLLFSAVLRAADDPGEALAQELKKIVDVFATVEQEAADPVSANQAFYQGAIPAMLRTLDPHSIFFDPDQFQQLQQMQKSEAKGFGTIVSIVPGRVIILQAIEGSPSAKAGSGRATRSWRSTELRSRSSSRSSWCSFSPRRGSRWWCWMCASPAMPACSVSR